MSESRAAEATPETALRTRSGRVSKPPTRYEPVEQVEDDYDAEDYDSNESATEDDTEEDDDEEDEEDDADEYGNLDGFVVADKSESDCSDSDDDGEPAVPVKAVPKRPAPVRK